MAVAAYNCTFSVTSLPSVSFTNEATTDDGTHTTYTITNSVKRYLDKSVAVVVQQGNDEIQTVTITGSPTGGTFTLTFGANTTGNIAYNAAASVVQTALVGLGSIGSGNAAVTGANGGPYTVRFQSSLGLANQAQMTGSGAGLTGGTSPNVSIATVQNGAAYATITSGFTLYYVNARVVYNTSQVLGTQVRLASGNYFPYATFGDAATAEFTAKMDMVDTTLFNTTGTHAFTPCLLSGTLKCSTWWTSETMVNHLTARDLLVVSFTLPSGNRYEGYCYTSDTDLKADPKTVIQEDLTFTLTDQFFAA